jgi:hypothetical protein
VQPHRSGRGLKKVDAERLEALLRRVWLLHIT